MIFILQCYFLLCLKLMHALNYGVPYGLNTTVNVLNSCVKIKINPETVGFQKLKLYNSGKNDLNFVKQIEIGDYTKNLHSESINLSKYKFTNYLTYLVLDFKEDSAVSATDYQTLVDSNVVHILGGHRLVIQITDKKISNSIENILKNQDVQKNRDATLQYYLQGNTEDDKINPYSVASITLYLFTEETKGNCDLELNVAPRFTMRLKNHEETDDGIIGILVLDSEWANGNIKTYYFDNKITQNLQTSVCQSLGYTRASMVRGGKKEKSMFDLGDKVCRKLFNYYLHDTLEPFRELYGKQQYSDRERENFCLNTSNKPKTVLNLKCSHRIGTYKSYARQSTSCTGLGNCPLGYYPKDDICVPKICHCSKGQPVESNYEYIKDFCGLTFNHRTPDDWMSQNIDVVDEEEEVLIGENDTVINLNYNSSSSRGTRMNGGSEISRLNMPFQAFLYPKNEEGHASHCSSAILNPRFLVTAAHCCFYGGRSLSKIYVTEKFLPGVPRIHEGYVHSQSGEDDSKLGGISVSRNDIALIEMESTTEIDANTLGFTKSQRPICLSDETDLEEFQLVVTGKSLEGQNLHILEMEELDMSECDANHAKDDTVEDNGLICARNENNGCKTTTKGDSGGPLMLKKLHSIGDELIYRWELVGIVSSAADTDCVKNNKDPTNDRKPFTLFTSITKHMDWILNKIRQENHRGRFCAYDNTIDCLNCNQGYSLQNKNCVENFSISRLNSMTEFFDGYYCSDNCVDFMGCRRRRVRYNKCTCTNGEPLKRCLKLHMYDGDRTETCDPEKCKIGYKYNSYNGECMPVNLNLGNLITISTYLAKNCDADKINEVVGDEWCRRLIGYPFNQCSLDVEVYYYDCIQKLCLKNYDSWSAEICVELENFEQECLLTKSVKNSVNNTVSMSSWRTDNFCPASCPGNYHSENGECVQNVCYCDHGVPVPAENCTEHGSHQCIDCIEGYLLNKYRAIHTNGLTFSETMEVCNFNSMKMVKILSRTENDKVELAIDAIDWEIYFRDIRYPNTMSTEDILTDYFEAKGISRVAYFLST